MIYKQTRPRADQNLPKPFTKPFLFFPSIFDIRRLELEVTQFKDILNLGASEGTGLIDRI
jgi:hypothetical protein